ncbi:PhzF family phenazine biosynthesis protein [Phenylobacterium terrae]|uniref:PhzF family phenazine biosynthesis protein n=1 Tax=Phenylobacterium terrae TaxID=2665495 RepID=A0ABW4N0Q2_9CAUL
MRQWTVDAFASEPFRGNPACVVEPVRAWPADAWMQKLAAENNQAETAYLLAGDDPARFGLRWFTPTTEVPLCGHATLASAHVLLAELGLGAPLVTFDTQSGPLTVRRAGGLYEMDFPAAQVRQVEVPTGLSEALGGLEVLEAWAAQMLVAVVRDEAAVRAARPDLAALNAISIEATMGRGNVAVAALADAGRPYQVVSRFFAPGSGIPEDPATGSLHCMLSPIYAAKLGSSVLKFHQAYPGRGGDLECELKGERVLLRGQAQTVLAGELRVAP